jgi:hypothetical protein
MTTPINPIQTTQFKVSDFTEAGLPFFNAQFTQLQNTVNALLGSAGKTQLASGIDVQGSTISSVGEPQSPTDAISKAHAEKNYSAVALAPQLESGAKGGAGLKTFRALNSKAQQEMYSTFLNSVMNTSPTCNSSIITGAAPSGGTVAVTVSAGYHYYVDNNKITPYGQRTDTFSLPTSYSISAISRTGNVVTVTTTTPSGLVPGNPFAIAGVTDSSYDGTFVAIAPTSGTTITYNQNGPNSSSSGGSVAVATTYYYYLQGNSQTLALKGPFPSDTQQNRLSINVDQSVLIAVAVLNSGGLDPTQSAAGATPPAVTANARLLTRL